MSLISSSIVSCFNFEFFFPILTSPPFYGPGHLDNYFKLKTLQLILYKDFESFTSLFLLVKLYCRYLRFLPLWVTFSNTYWNIGEQMADIWLFLLFYLKFQTFASFRIQQSILTGRKVCRFYYTGQNCAQLGQTLFQTSKTSIYSCRRFKTRPTKGFNEEC